MKTRLLLIDSHPLIYGNKFAKGARDLKTSTGIQSGAFYGSLKTLLTIKNRFPNAYMICAFDGGSSGRHVIYPDYKPVSERAEDVQDAIDHVRLFCTYVGIPVLYTDGIEADDLISIAAVTWLNRNSLYHSMIVSSDNDFFQLVGSRLTMFDNRAKIFYGPEEVFKKTGVSPQHFLSYKCLKGDVADHIPGIPGFGPVKAAKFAPLRLHGVPEGYQGDFERNKKLMQLPKSFKEMSHVFTQSQQRQHMIHLDTIFHVWETDEGRHLRIPMAQKMLDYYEVLSIKPEDFL